MIAVDGISTTTEIIIVSIRSEHVIHIIVNPLEGEKRSIFIALGSMIEYGIQDDFNTVFFECLYQLL